MSIWKKKNKIKNSEITIEDLQGYLNEMVELGFIEITDYTDKGEPRYSITPLGKLELEFAPGD